VSELEDTSILPATSFLAGHLRRGFKSLSRIVTLTAPAPVGVTACSSLHCAQPMQQHSIQMPTTTPVSGLHFQTMPGRVAHDSLGCTDSKLAAQQIAMCESPCPVKPKGRAADCTARSQPSSVLDTQLGNTPQKQYALAMEVSGAPIDHIDSECFAALAQPQGSFWQKFVSC